MKYLIEKMRQAIIILLDSLCAIALDWMLQQVIYNV